MCKKCRGKAKRDAPSERKVNLPRNGRVKVNVLDFDEHGGVEEGLHALRRIEGTMRVTETQRGPAKDTRGRRDPT